MRDLAQILFGLGIAAWIAWVVLRRYYNVDLDRHKKTPPPTDDQIRWHIWNMRKDISMLAVTNFGILMVLVFTQVLKL